MDEDLHKCVRELLGANMGIRAAARHANSSTTVLKIRDQVAGYKVIAGGRFGIAVIRADRHTRHSEDTDKGTTKYGLHFATCFYQGTEHAIGDGLQRFDAGAQGEHKLICGFKSVITLSGHWLAHPGLRSAVGEFVRQGRGVQAHAGEARGLHPYRQA
ncbi:hypothetical protein D3879_23610 [Pseudomonas cavernicola]|uniref:Uncharacterized protein n=1 Tax=Pseudomonas cavernicola TaxID=2320866 RepID=A0A418X8N2_9PSED|nr:hypothetical protein D3879_23610 [Pseudomonas cavernicola]